jgi:hypothetical protein
MIIKGQTGNIGIGTSVPSASLHISGSSNSTLLEIDSPAVNNILYVSGSGNVGIGTSTPTSTLHVKGLTTVYASSSFKVENSTTSGSFKVTDTGKLFLAVNNSIGYNEPQTTNSASMYIYEGPNNSGRAGITIHSGQSAANGSFLHLFNYISHWASGIQHYSAGGGAIQKMRFYIGYDASQQLGDGGNIMTISSNGLGINTLATEITANLQVKGSGTTSSTTALLVQNANASASLSVKDGIDGSNASKFQVIAGNWIDSAIYTATVWRTGSFASAKDITIGSDGILGGSSNRLNFINYYSNSGQGFQSNFSGYLRTSIEQYRPNGTGQPSGRGTLLLGVYDTDYDTITLNSFDVVSVGKYATTISGSLTLSGSLINQSINLPTASGTASMDCSKSNFFNLTLSGSYTLFLSASNIQPGQTINLRVIQPATSGSLNYGSQFKFAGGIPYSASATSSTVDIISFISYDTTTLYGSAIKNLS